MAVKFTDAEMRKIHSPWFLKFYEQAKAELKAENSGKRLRKTI
ncbi:MAG: hypothetical protein ABH854_02790 [Candidatus Diapherotrites archaeon]